MKHRHAVIAVSAAALLARAAVPDALGAQQPITHADSLTAAQSQRLSLADAVLMAEHASPVVQDRRQRSHARAGAGVPGA